MSEWIHKGCGGKVRTHTIDKGGNIIVIARCEKCDKEWVLGTAIMVMGVPLMMPNPDQPEDIEVLEERGGSE